MKKYELIPETGEAGIYRLKALRSFGTVRAGDLGGLVGEHNLSQEGLCWIYDEAEVLENAKVRENAEVREFSKIYNEADIFGNAIVKGYAHVYDYAKVFDFGQVLDFAQVYDDAEVCENGIVGDFSHVSGNARVTIPCVYVKDDWTITITDNHMQIGCEIHPIDDWFKFDDTKIDSMHREALPWWQRNKVWVQQLCQTRAV